MLNYYFFFYIFLNYCLITKKNHSISEPPKILLQNFQPKRKWMVDETNESDLCPHVGSPPIQVHWNDNGTIISNEKLNSDVNRFKLSTERNITCIVENAFGKDIYTVPVQIIGNISPNSMAFKKEG